MKVNMIILKKCAGLAGAVLFGFGVLAQVGCGTRGEKESQMTSYTASESKSETASLFTVPADQMAHVQVVKAVKASLPRNLRFTGSVAYDALTTTPVFSAVGGPVKEIPGRTGRFRQGRTTVAPSQQS